MGQKVHPHGLRLGITSEWLSRWYAEKEFPSYLSEDKKIRDIIKNRLRHAGISKVVIERFTKKLRITIHTARPGIIIGRRGQEVERLKKVLAKNTDRTVLLSVEEVKNPNTDAQLVAESIAGQLERRASYRRVLKRAMKDSLDASGVEGVRLAVSGRLGGAEIARYEWYREGRVPLHTFRADIDYGFAIARTTYGVIGVKCWLFKGEKIGEIEQPTEQPEAPEVSSQPEPGQTAQIVSVSGDSVAAQSLSEKENQTNVDATA